MSISTNRYEPDYAVPLGWVLEERLASSHMSQSELARRCGRSKKLISEIVSGRAKIEPATALQFEKVLGVDASIWTGMEADYRVHLEREADARKAADSEDWATRFPIDELIHRGVLQDTSSTADMVNGLLSFLGVGSPEAWEAKSRKRQVAYHHSPCFDSDQYALATWLRFGEIEAERSGCPDYSEASFKSALNEVRQMTSARSPQVIADAARLCSASGVVVSIVKPLPKTAVSGAAWWHTPRRPVIQLSGRYKTDDHLWFSLFHEAAHILLHSKTAVFLREDAACPSDAEAEASKWAADFLVSKRDWERFTKSTRFTASGVTAFATQQGIAPGIVVGRLQNEERIPWSRLNHLKVKLKWVDDPKMIQ